MKSGNVVSSLFNDSGPSIGVAYSKNYTLNVKKGYKIQMYGQNSSLSNYVFYEVSGYVLY